MPKFDFDKPENKHIPKNVYRLMNAIDPMRSEEDKEKYADFVEGEIYLRRLDRDP